MQTPCRLRSTCHVPRVDTGTFLMWTVDSVDTGPVSLSCGFMELRNTKVWAAAAAAMIHPVHLNQASREQQSRSPHVAAVVVSAGSSAVPVSPVIM